MVRESGIAEILPTVRAIVFDEAHQLNDIGVQFLGTTLSTGQLRDFFRDILATGVLLARGLADWQGLSAASEHAVRALRWTLAEARGEVKGEANSRLRWQAVVPDGLDAQAWGRAFTHLGDILSQACTALDTVSEIAPDFVRLFERGTALAAKLARFAQACPMEGVRWLDVTASRAASASLRMVESPLDIAEAFQRKRMALGGSVEREHSWIFTSATLGTDADLTWFKQSAGLTDAQVLRVSSPFDYLRQAALYVPTDLPKPADPDHSASVSALVARAVTQLGGRTLVLTTTLRALRTIGETLTAHFERVGGIEVLVQGQWPKRRLMARFRESNASGQRGCVLVASATFWEGFDVPGEALQLVVIDKLPFPPPHDPLVEARSARLASEGRNAFNDYFVPEATVALKQGTGRLIRQETDHGVLIVCDTRLASMGYGRRILAALPAMRRLHSDSELTAALAALLPYQNFHHALPEDL
jgi:ATP-dependent DNA helicase DinG